MTRAEHPAVTLIRDAAETLHELDTALAGLLHYCAFDADAVARTGRDPEMNTGTDHALRVARAVLAGAETEGGRL